MRKRLVMVLLVLVSMLGLAACKDKKPAVPRDPVASGDLAGTYWLHTMRDGGEEMDRKMLEMFGFDDSFLRLDADGTAVLSFTGEDRVELEYDEDEGVLYDEDGDTMSFSVDGDEITLLHDGSEMVFKREAGSQVATTAPTTAPAQQETTGDTEPEETTAPAQTDPSEPDDPTQPQQTTPPQTTAPIEPAPTEPVSTESEEAGLAGMYWLYEISSEGEVLDYDLLKFAGIDDSYLRLDPDGTGELYLTDEDPIALTYDEAAIYDDTGVPMDIQMEGDKLTVLSEGSTEILVFVREGSALLG